MVTSKMVGEGQQVYIACALGARRELQDIWDIGAMHGLCGGCRRQPCHTPHAKLLRCVLSTCCCAGPFSAAAQPSATCSAPGGTTCSTRPGTRTKQVR